MNYTELYKEIKNATLFDLARISEIIYNEIENPEKIREIKKRLEPGMTIQYYDGKGNRLIDADIIELKRTNLLVRNRDDHKKWYVKYAYVKPGKVNTDISVPNSSQGLDRNHLKVGETVGFYHNASDVYG